MRKADGKKKLSALGGKQKFLSEFLGYYLLCNYCRLYPTRQDCVFAFNVLYKVYVFSDLLYKQSELMITL